MKLRAASLLYIREFGEKPKSIQDLVPRFMREVPRDIYSGNEVQYKAREGMFYVIGPDLKDDGGKGDVDRQHNISYEGDIIQYIFPVEDGEEEGVSSVQE